MATRRIGGATLDHGAQFFTVRGDAFGAQVAAWEADGVARVWCHGFTAEGDGYPRYVGTRGMSAIAKHMAVGLDVRCGALTFAIRRAGWWFARVGGRRRRRHGPSRGRGGFDVPARRRRSRCCSRPGSTSRANWWPTTTTARSPSSPCSTAPSAVPPPGGVQLADGDVLVRRRQRGQGHQRRSGRDVARRAGLERAALGRATAPRSTTRWSTAARPWLGSARVVDSQVKRWRFATPRTPWPEPCWVAPEGSLVVAGDAFAGPKIEGAYNSGSAAASGAREPA